MVVQVIIYLVNHIHALPTPSPARIPAGGVPERGRVRIVLTHRDKKIRIKIGIKIV